MADENAKRRALKRIARRVGKRTKPRKTKKRPIRAAKQPAESARQAEEPRSLTDLIGETPTPTREEPAEESVEDRVDMNEIRQAAIRATPDTIENLLRQYFEGSISERDIEKLRAYESLFARKSPLTEYLQALSEQEREYLQRAEFLLRRAAQRIVDTRIYERESRFYEQPRPEPPAILERFIRQEYQRRDRQTFKRET